MSPSIPRNASARGPRVFLRRPVAADEAEVVAAARRSRLLHRPWVTAPTSPASFADWLAGSHVPTRERLLVCARESGAIAGYFSLGEIVHESLKSAYLGYWVSAGFAGRGFMAEGMRLTLGHAFRGIKLHRVEANIQPGNGASISLVRRSGFRKEGFSPRYLKVAGRWRDHERWALTVEDWREQLRRG